MDIEDLRVSMLPEYPKYSNPEHWPTRQDLPDQTVIRFDWDEDASEIFNWNNLITTYVEIWLRGAQHCPEASPYLSAIQQEDFMERLKQEYEVLRKEVMQFRYQKNFSEAVVTNEKAM
jgi:hypothetical protein